MIDYIIIAYLLTKVKADLWVFILLTVVVTIKVVAKVLDENKKK